MFTSHDEPGFQFQGAGFFPRGGLVEKIRSVVNLWMLKTGWPPCQWPFLAAEVHIAQIFKQDPYFAEGLPDCYQQFN